MNTIRIFLNRLKMDMIVLASPLTIMSVLVICTLQTINFVTKPWNQSSSIGKVIFEMYGGIVWYEFISPEAAAFWLLQLLPCGVAFSSFLSQSMGRHLALYTYRYGSQTAWWLSKVVSNLLNCFLISLVSGLWCAILSKIAGLQDLRVAMQDAEGFRVLSVFPVGLTLLSYALHLCVLSSFGMLVYLITRNTKVSMLSFLLPVTYAIMRHSGDDPFLMDNRHRIVNWGMSKRFSFNGSFGVQIDEAMMGMVLLIVIVTLLGLLVQMWVNQTQRQST